MRNLEYRKFPHPEVDLPVREPLFEAARPKPTGKRRQPFAIPSIRDAAYGFG